MNSSTEGVFAKVISAFSGAIWNPPSDKPCGTTPPFLVTLTLPTLKLSEIILSTLLAAIVSEPTVIP